jgi:hypothetical protein
MLTLSLTILQAASGGCRSATVRCRHHCLTGQLQRQRRQLQRMRRHRQRQRAVVELQRPLQRAAAAAFHHCVHAPDCYARGSGVVAAQRWTAERAQSAKLRE